MLRFIVLGEIPGTNTSLTFGEVMLILVSFYAAILTVHELKHRRPSQPSQEEIAL